MEVGIPQAFLILVLDKHTWWLEQIPSPLPNTRNVVIKQPIGSFVLSSIDDYLYTFRCRVSCIILGTNHHHWCSTLFLQLHPDTMEFSFRYDYTKTCRSPRRRMYCSYQATTWDSILFPCSRRGVTSCIRIPCSLSQCSTNWIARSSRRYPRWCHQYRHNPEKCPRSR